MRTAILMGCLLLAKTQPGFSQAKDLALGFAIIATIAIDNGHRRICETNDKKPITR